MAAKAGNPYFRLGYNNLSAFATVNHLHFHVSNLPICLHLGVWMVQSDIRAHTKILFDIWLLCMGWEFFLHHMMVRAIVFGSHKKVFVLYPKVLTYVLLDLLGLLFFSTYTLLVLFWAEIYHQARSLPMDKLRILYMPINGVVYVISFWCHKLNINTITIDRRFELKAS